MVFVSNNCTHYYQIKTPKNFWCNQELNSKFPIKPLKTLPVKLTETHVFSSLNYMEFTIFLDKINLN